MARPPGRRLSGSVPCATATPRGSRALHLLKRYLCDGVLQPVGIIPGVGQVFLQATGQSLCFLLVQPDALQEVKSGEPFQNTDLDLFSNQGQLAHNAVCSHWEEGVRMEIVPKVSRNV